ncbi:MAG: GntR family transcriptional regulator [Actinomycetota bacterium]|nr:GntR family transcriptional regulator [Actinomycetota bacterium]
MAVSSELTFAQTREHLVVDETSSLPLYVQLRDRMRSMATALGVSARFPSESEIIRATGLSRITVRRAIADLTQEGVLRTQRGRGTFVTAGNDEEALQAPEGFSRVMTRLGHVPSSEVLAAGVGSATAKNAPHLNLEVGDPVVTIKRLRLMSGTPCMLEVAHLSLQAVPGILEQDLAGSLYVLLADTFGLRIARGTERIIAVSADDEAAQVLGVPPQAPLLSTTRTTWTESGVPVEYTERLARADLMAFRVTLDAGSWLGARTAPKTSDVVAR